MRKVYTIYKQQNSTDTPTYVISFLEEQVAKKYLEDNGYTEKNEEGDELYYIVEEEIEVGSKDVSKVLHTQMILKFLRDTVDVAYASRKLETSYYQTFRNGYAVMLDWQEGFDTEDEHELCVSLRVVDSNMFADYWDVVGESCSIDKDNVQYEELTNFVIGLMYEVI